MNLFLGALQQGLLYSILGMGVFLSFRILRTPDLTVDGSFILGGAVSAILVLSEHPFAAVPVSFAAGVLAGVITALLQVKLGVIPILSGVLTMSGLYTVNLAIQGGAPNLSLINCTTFFNGIPGLEKETAKTWIPAVFCIIVATVLIWFLHTQYGLCIRAIGNNTAMGGSLGINEEGVRMLGLGLANGCAALCGGLMTQYQGYGDVNGGNGSMLAGLAGVILGETIFHPKGITARLLCATAGAIIYQMVIALAVRYNIFPAYAFKLISAGLITLVLGLGYLGKRKSNRR